MYEDGKGVTRDLEQAVSWYQKAAEQGNAVAQNNLGLMYLNGSGVKKDSSQAVYWLKKSAVQGNLYAKRELENMK
jgi:TPR repeat protein